MGNLLKTLGLSGHLAILALVTVAAEPSWALANLPGPAAGGLVGAAVIGALVIAKLWRKK